MISLLLLLKIIGAICFIAGWVFMYRIVRRTERRLECLKEHYDARLSALAEAGSGAEAGGPEEEARESRLRALEAERRFTEGIASIFNFSVSSLGDAAPSAELNRKKGDS